MALREIPLDPDIDSFIQKVDLDGRPFELRFKFNDRTERWSIDISDEAGNLLVGGIPLFVRQDLLALYKYNQSLPQGELFAINEVNENDPPARNNLGTDVLLLYNEVDE